MFPRQRLNYNNDERCFLRVPRRGIINGTSLEFSQFVRCKAKRERNEFVGNVREFACFICDVEYQAIILKVEYSD
jgi:hypothetical protein